MFDLGEAAYMFGPIDLPDRPVPNLRTGEGHGHYRAWTREKLEKGYHKKKRLRAKMAKKSKRRNRT